MSMELLSAVDRTTELSLASYLEKPTVLLTGVFGVGDTPTTFSKIPLPLIMVGKTIYRDKLQGFLGFRADIELTLVVNAQRFQQGRYMLYFVPIAGAGGVNASNREAHWDNLHEANLTTRTQLPHVEIDLNCDTTARLEIPYVSAVSCYPMGAAINTFNIGAVRVSPYQAINTGTATFTLWARFKNVKFVGAALPQSGRIKFKSKTVQEKEREDGNIGPISGLLSKVSTAASELGKIPLISSFTAPVAFVSQVLSNTAAIFGWSKPNMLSPPGLMYKDRMRYGTNYDGVSVALPLSMSGSNELQTVAFGGTDYDEMSFDFLKTIPAYYSTFNFAVSDLVNSQIGIVDVSGFMSVNHTVGVTTTTTYLPCTIPSNTFSMYRGSVTLTLKAVKTEFHSGRIAVVFEPNAGYSTSFGVGGIINSDYCHRAIIDVREGNQWSFNIPYISAVQWRSYGDTNHSYGRVRFYVIDPLIAPATVSSTINFLIEVSGGEDLEFALPRAPEFAPVVPYTIQSGCLKFDSVLGASTPDVATIAPAALCIGEKFTSYRQLLKRYCVVPKTGNYAPTDYFIVFPFLNELSFAPVAPMIQATVGPDYYSILACMYSQVRGSIRIALANTNGITVSNKGSLSYVVQTQGTTPPLSTALAAGTDIQGNVGPEPLACNLVAFTENDSNLVIANVQIPGYYSNGSAATADCMTVNAPGVAVHYSTIDATNPKISLNTTFISKGGDLIDNAPTLLRAGADDMSFAGFVSTVPMTTLTYSNQYTG